MAHPPTWLWAPCVSAVVIGIIGALGVWAGLPWLIASLAPTIALQTVSPDHPTARARNVASAHVIGLAAGLLAVFATGAIGAPPFTDGHSLSLVRVAAATLAILVGIGAEAAFGTFHAPASSTTLLVALGVSAPTERGIVAILCGIALVTVFGEVARRLRLATDPARSS